MSVGHRYISVLEGKTCQKAVSMADVPSRLNADGIQRRAKKSDAVECL